MAESNTLEIIRGLAQAAANVYDGGYDERYSLDGEARKVGLKREEGDPILDRRVIDGFKIKFYANEICLHYHGEVKLKEVYGGKFESEMERMLNEIKKFLQKEYKVVTGKSITLTAKDEPYILVQSTSRVRSWVQAHQFFKIGGLKNDPIKAESDPKKLEKNFRDFLAMGRDQAKKPKNITRKKD